MAGPKNYRAPRRAWIVALALVIAVMAAVWLARPLTYVYAARQYGPMPFGRPIAAGSHLVQTFHADGPNLAAVSVFAAAANKHSAANLRLVLYRMDGASRETLAELSVPARRLSNNNGQTTLYFPPVGMRDEGEKLWLDVTADAAPGVWLLANEKDTYAGGEATVDGRPAGDLAFAAYSRIGLLELPSRLSEPARAHPLAPLSVILFAVLLLALASAYCLRLLLE